MNLSSKLLKYLEGMKIIELLHDDERAIFPLFALCFDITGTTALSQAEEFDRDLLNGILHEIPDFDVNEMSNPSNYTGTGKLQYELYRYGDKRIIDVLIEEFGEEKLYGTFKDLYDKSILATIKKIASKARDIGDHLQDAPASLYENNFPNLMKRFDWTEVEEEYQKEKRRNCVTMDWLQEKQENVLKEALELDIMHHADEPSIQYLESVDYDYHRSFLPCSYTPPTIYKKAYAKIMKLAKRVKGLFIPNLGEYGKHFAPILYNFRPEQKYAIFKVIKKMELIHKDMVQENEELGQYLGFNQENTESLENTKLFAPYFHLTKMLGEGWFKKNRNDAKYNEQWADKLIEGLLRSEFGLQIANDWKDCGDKIKGYVIGCLKEAGVFKENVSNDSLARDADIISNTRTFSKYIGSESRKQPYAEWVKTHVNDYCK